MTIPITTTKLFIPSPALNRVSRTRLLERLEGGLASKLTIISAPAGYGKTTLLSEWINQSDIPFAWLSLDQYDDDLLRLLAYIIASLQSIRVDINDQILNLYQSPSNPFTTILPPLINQITAVDQRFCLVLDDYHLIQSQEIHQTLIYLLDNIPQQLHLVIATRTDPPLRLAQYRARAELCEIRSEDLRFTLEEATQFLNQCMDLNLSARDVTILTEKTEGWITGLQLAAISLQKHPDKHQFVTAFAGDDRYIADYLLDEALDRQSPHIHRFLVQTSILDRLNASLCDAVTDREDSSGILQQIERANLFLLPIDHHRNWYRYHHLFADLLKKRLVQTQANQIYDLHKRASHWYEANGLLPDAINHALAINDIERITQLTEEMAVDKMDHRELNVFLVWLDRLSDETYQDHPWLLVAQTWALFNTGKYEEVDINLNLIDKILANQTMPFELSTRIQGHVAAIKTYLAELREDAASTMGQAENALAMLPDKDVKLRSFIAIRWANCLVWFGIHEKGIQVFKEAGELGKQAGDGQLSITAFSEMAAVQMVTGKLRQAVESINNVKNYADMLAQKDGRRLPATGKLYFHLSHIKHELNELSEAEYYAKEAVNISRQWGEKEALVFSLRALVRAYAAQEEQKKAEETLISLMENASQISPLILDEMRNWSVYFYLQQGKLEEVELWAEEIEFTYNGNYSQNTMYKGLNLARFQIAKGNYTQGLEIINNLLKLVAKVGADGYTIKLNVLMAIVLQRLKRTEEAMTAMENALLLAHAEGYIRSFLDEGEPVAQLLYIAAQEGIYPDYCQKLLDEFSKQISSVNVASKRSSELIEPLTDREIEVLNNIAQGLTNREIAQQLVLSLHTVKSHARNIYGKLGVKNRTEAVARARLLGLLSQN